MTGKSRLLAVIFDCVGACVVVVVVVVVTVGVVEPALLVTPWVTVLLATP